MPGYNPAQIEKKWQQFWADNKTFATNTADHSKPKYYALDMFPYPSGQGLHVGHPEGYTATDIVSRYKRAKGFNVMHPMGWDAFGLPAEQYAIKNNVHPRETTANNINRFRTQLQSLGFSYDWAREVDTTEPAYYKWTQWIFLQLYNTWFDETQQKGRPISELIAEFQSGARPIPPIENRKSKIENWSNLNATEQRNLLAQYRLAYESEAPVNWCPGLGTVLANEEVIDGKSEVGSFPVERRPMKQWMLRITAYANRLLEGLQNLDWSDSLKEMQRNWIGQSEGAEVTFKIDGTSESLTVFTTRPDTLFGATYLVVAPEHPLITQIVERQLSGLVDMWEASVPLEWQYEQHSPKAGISAYKQWTASRPEMLRQIDTGHKTGVFTGLFAINPVIENPVKARIPIFMSDYVLMTYGTGAIMAVPAHDARDWDFATKFNLKKFPVVMPADLMDEGIALFDRFFGTGEFYSLVYLPKANTIATKEKVVELAEEVPGTASKLEIIEGRAGGVYILIPKELGEGFSTGLPPPHRQFPLHEAFTGDGIAISSPWIDDLPTPQAKSKIIALFEEKNIGQRRINYKLRDWLFSRQRYWGEPFPLVHLEDGTTVALAESELPLLLPELADFKPTGIIDPPLSKASEWVNVHVTIDANHAAHVVPPTTPGAVPARRELNTMPQWAGSCWYYIRYLDPKNAERFVNPAIEKYWLGPPPEIENRKSKIENPPLPGGVDLYIGGVEHAVLHLLYARFWHKVLHDRGHLSADEPFKKLVNQGLILGEDMQKMSKSRGNVVNPDDVVKEYGADSLRLFEMFMGPLEQVKPWSTAGVEGVYRFLQRVWRNLFDENDNPKVTDTQDSGLKTHDLLRPLHRLIKKVGDDIERLAFNTAISAMMEFNNTLGDLARKGTPIPTQTALTFLRLLEPFAPHFAEEANTRLQPQASSLKPQASITSQPWPTYDPALLIDASIEIPVQVNGKVRGRISVPNDAAEAAILQAALADPEVQKHLAGKEPKKKIYIKGRMVNLVV